MPRPGYLPSAFKRAPGVYQVGPRCLPSGPQVSSDGAPIFVFTVIVFGKTQSVYSLFILAKHAQLWATRFGSHALIYKIMCMAV